MLYKISFLSVVFLSLINCSSQTATNSDNSAPIEVSQSGEITLKEGESKMIKDSGITITFKSVSQDSRCPEGVNCVWEGVAVAELEVKGASKNASHISLATMTSPQQNFSKTAVYDGHQIELKNVLPYPKQGVEKGNYTIEVSVHKLAENKDETVDVTTK